MDPKNRLIRTKITYYMTEFLKNGITDKYFLKVINSYPFSKKTITFKEAVIQEYKFTYCQFV